jgi:hypothetical protein
MQTQGTGTEDIKNGLEQDINKRKKDYGKMWEIGVIKSRGG